MLQAVLPVGPINDYHQMTFLATKSAAQINSWIYIAVLLNATLHPVTSAREGRQDSKERRNSSLNQYIADETKDYHQLDDKALMYFARRFFILSTGLSRISRGGLTLICQRSSIKLCTVYTPLAKTAATCLCTVIWLLNTINLCFILEHWAIYNLL